MKDWCSNHPHGRPHDGEFEMSMLRHGRRLLAVLAVCATAQNGATNEPFNRFAWEGNLSEVRALLEHGANPNVRDETGHTPLTWAASTLAHPRIDANKPSLPDYH